MRQMIFRDHEKPVDEFLLQSTLSRDDLTDERKEHIRDDARRRQLTCRVAKSGIPIRYREARLDRMDTTNTDVLKMVKRAQAYLDGAEWKMGRGLYLSGAPGVGKTLVAAAVLRELIHRRVESSVFWTVPDLLGEIRSSFDRKDHNDHNGASAMDEAMKCRVLVLDDIGTEKPSEWVRETLYMLIDHRYANMLPTIYTSNHDLGKLRDTLEPQFTGDGKLGKITGRIYETCAPPVWVDAPDYRTLGNARTSYPCQHAADAR